MRDRQGGVLSEQKDVSNRFSGAAKCPNGIWFPGFRYFSGDQS